MELSPKAFCQDRRFEDKEYLIINLAVLWNNAAGKKALLDNPGRFNQEAAEAFRRIDEKQKEELKANLPEPTVMTTTDISKRATAIFQKISKSVRSI